MSALACQIKTCEKETWHMSGICKSCRTITCDQCGKRFALAKRDQYMNYKCYDCGKRHCVEAIRRTQ